MAIDTATKRASALNTHSLGDLLPVPDGSITQPDRQHIAGFYGGIAAGVPNGNYNLYVGIGGVTNIDFSASPAVVFPGNTSSGDLTSYGFAASTKYTLVLRPELTSGLETPDLSAFADFKLDSGTEWVGSRPDAAQSVTAEVRSGGVIRLTWYHRVTFGATPDDFLISYGTDATASDSTTTQTYAGDKKYTKDLTLSDGVQYFFRIHARTSTVQSEPVNTLGVTADSSAPSAPSTTVTQTWQTL